MKKCNLKFLYIILYFTSSFALFSENVQTVNASAAHRHLQIITRNNYVGWRYTTINGLLYKRLYDYSNECWIGEWIRA